jgi:hypothetical protein
MGSASRHRSLLISIALALAVALRLYPYFLNGVPFGTDEWPLIRNTNEMLAHSPTTLGGNPIFDNYNIYWPGVSIFGGVSSLILGQAPIAVMPVIVPLAASFSTLIFFVIVEKLTKSTLAAFIASLFFASAGFDAIFTASATKETFAYPLFMLGLLFLLVETDLRSATLFTITSLAMALSHHVTVVIFIAIAGSVVGAKAILSLGKYDNLGKKWILPLITAVIFVAYFEVYAVSGWAILGNGAPISVSGSIPLIALLIAAEAFAIYFMLARKMRSMFVLGVVIFAAGVALILLDTSVSVLPFAPVVSLLFVLIALPYLAVGVLSIAGYKFLHDVDRSSFAFGAAWLAATLALIGYTVIGTPNGIGLIARLFAFVYAPIALFGAVALVTLYSKARRRVGVGSLIGVAVFAILVLSSYASYAAVVNQVNNLGGHWSYKQSDYAAAAWAGSVSMPNANYTGDSRVLYLFSYFGLSVDQNLGYEYLLVANNTAPKEPLVTYALMNSEGYSFSAAGVPLPPNWQDELSSHASLIYDNGNEMIWG